MVLDFEHPITRHSGPNLLENTTSRAGADFTILKLRTGPNSAHIKRAGSYEYPVFFSFLLLISSVPEPRFPTEFEFEIESGREEGVVVDQIKLFP